MHAQTIKIITLFFIETKIFIALQLSHSKLGRARLKTYMGFSKVASQTLIESYAVILVNKLCNATSKSLTGRIFIFCKTGYQLEGKGSDAA